MGKITRQYKLILMRLATFIFLERISFEVSSLRMSIDPEFLCQDIDTQFCYERDIDIDGNLFRSNVLADITPPVSSAQDCQSHCKEWKSQGCVAFVYEEVPKTCTLYSNIKHIEYDEDKDKKVMGYVDGCLSALCHRPGWDYVRAGSGANLQGNGYIESVRFLRSCGRICSFVDDC